MHARDETPNRLRGIMGKNSGTRILVVDDVPANLDVLRQVLEGEGYQVLLAPNGEVALRNAQRAHPDLILLDVMMPDLNGYEVCRRLKDDAATADIPVIFITANDDTESLVKGFQVGAVDFVGKPFREEEVIMRSRTHLQIGRLTRELEARASELEEKNQKLEEEVALRRLLKTQLSEMAERDAKSWGLDGLIADSAPMKRVMEQVRTMQEADAGGVFIHGEEGTGRELVARAIHYGSPRSGGAFVKLNCRELPQDVIESMDSRTQALSKLFGHVAGAFPDAGEDCEGHFQLAADGTLYLENVEHLPMPLQASLLRALETGTARRIGDDLSVHVDVRIILSGEHGMTRLIADGALQEQMPQRFGDEIQLPTLAQRGDDIAGLVSYFAAQTARQLGKPVPEVTAAALAALRGMPLTGNVPQLRELVEQGMLASGGGSLGAEHLKPGSGAANGEAA
jgi:DNA-binding NtrC family response regulator